MNDKTKLAAELSKHKHKADIPWEDLAQAIGVRAKTLYRMIHEPEEKIRRSTLMLVANYLKNARNGHGK